MNILKSILISAAALTISACSAIPEELQTPEGTNLVSFERALTQPTEAVGETARWGGVIASVSNTDNGTIIEVVNFDLKNWGRPLVSDESNGRFRAVLESFVDPLVYQKGRSITVVGEVIEPVEGTIDEYKYLFPTVAVTSKKLWTKERKADVQIDYSPLWFRHQFYGPYPYYYRPHTRVRTLETKPARSGGATNQQQH
ncbi:outer membrane lipoprotein [Pseudidiomarina planktonica]|uniref:Outer membrane lipoprotein n=1 Tax=Pseudidiomarina planktonica TaxID=1323738 RepID=A0A1Y6F5A0_9GAMM|nr:Slp family lipoprotein [Pseudidiomarina planktonica]RUO64973.1 starvation-inducible protein [Pseudidiomarina planktonica]SMQ68721.1 outer membrane lipoprotein [Pseudidiomarina planktonica]